MCQQVSVLKTVSRCVSTGVCFKNCVTVSVNRVAIPGRTELVCVCGGGGGGVCDEYSFNMSRFHRVSVLKTVSVNRVAMSVTMTVQCVMVSVNRVAMPGRAEVCVCVCVCVCVGGCL